MPQARKEVFLKILTKATDGDYINEWLHAAF